MTHIEWETGRAKALVGGHILSIVHNKESFGFRVWVPKVARRKSKWFVVWVDCDPEGNGPGHLQIEERNAE